MTLGFVFEMELLNMGFFKVCVGWNENLDGCGILHFYGCVECVWCKIS